MSSKSTLNLTLILTSNWRDPVNKMTTKLCQIDVKFWSNNWCDINSFVNILHQNWREIWHQFWHQIDVIASTRWQQNDVKLMSNFGQIIDVTSIFSLTFWHQNWCQIWWKFWHQIDVISLTRWRQNDVKLTSKTSNWFSRVLDKINSANIWKCRVWEIISWL